MVGRSGVSADDRDPELRFDVVFTSRSHKRAVAAAERLRSHRFDVLEGVADHRSRRGRATREYRVLVPRAHALEATGLLGVPLVIDEDDVDVHRFIDPPGHRQGLRRRLGRNAFDGLQTAAWIIGVLLVICLILLVVS